MPQSHDKGVQKRRRALAQKSGEHRDNLDRLARELVARGRAHHAVAGPAFHTRRDGNPMDRTRSGAPHPMNATPSAKETPSHD